jgi:phage shock protein A
MGLFRRISDIVSANLNEMTERFEDPEKMLKQAIREMETSIADATEQTAKALASEKILAKEQANNESQARQWQDRAEKAVSAGDDELARKALARKQEHEKLVLAIKDQIGTNQEANLSLRRQLDGMKAKMAEAKRSLATLSARQKAADFRKKLETSAAEVDFSSVQDNAFAKFERLREKVEQTEAEADALAELRRESVAVSEYTGATEKDLDVEVQLEELKKKLKS